MLDMYAGQADVSSPGFAGVRHLSLDLWLTIIRSDPDFKPARAALLARRFGISASTDEVVAAFRHYDGLFTVINEHTGRNPSAEELCYLVLARLGRLPATLAFADVAAFCVDSEALLHTHQPVLLDARLPAQLAALGAQGITASIGSNTGFLRGRALRGVLDRLGVGQHLAFQLYSDEIEVSKPNHAFFARVMVAARRLHPGAPLTPRHILHVGDNPIADVAGALACGLQAALLPPGQLLCDLLTPLCPTALPALQPTP